MVSCLEARYLPKISGVNASRSGLANKMKASGSYPEAIPSISMPFLSSEATRPKLRVAVLVDEQGVPCYGCAVIDDLLRADFVEVVGWLQLSTARPRRTGGLMFWLFCKYIEPRYPAAPDPFEIMKCEALFARTKTQAIQIPAGEDGDPDPCMLSSALRELGPDVVVDLSSTELHGEHCAIPRYGFWRYHFGDSRKYPDGSGFLREIIDNEPLTAVELKIITAARDFDEVLCRGEFSTQPYPSRLINRLGPVWSAQHFVIQELWKLHTAAPRRRVHSTGIRINTTSGRQPSGASIALWLSRKYLRWLRGQTRAAYRRGPPSTNGAS
jgi:hypothetical protein